MIQKFHTPYLLIVLSIVLFSEDKENFIDTISK